MTSPKETGKGKKVFHSWGERLPETAIGALSLWDKGEIIPSIELGGLGPSYEMVIQVSAFELIRHFKGKAPKGTNKEIQDIMDNALFEMERTMKFGHSGGTAGQAKWLAYRYMKSGYKKTIQEAPSDRIIQIEKKSWRFGA